MTVRNAAYMRCKSTAPSPRTSAMLARSVSTPLRSRSGATRHSISKRSPAAATGTCNGWPPSHSTTRAVVNRATTAVAEKVTGMVMEP